MSQVPEYEHRAIFEALATLDDPTDRPPEDPLAQEYTAVFALLPYALEPVAPPPDLRHDLLRRIAAGDRAADPRVLPLRQRSETPPAPSAAPTKSTLRSRPWMPALAAGLLICLLGITLILGFQLRSQQRTIDSLVVTLEGRTDQQVEIERLRYQLADFEQRFNMITTVAAGLYPLRAPEPEQAATGKKKMMVAPRGVMYVCANHQQWYLHLQNLAPTPEGQAYYLWFLTDDGPVEMDTFQIREFGQPVQVRRVSMPPTTHGVLVSLQPLGEVSEPTGPVVLRGDRSITL